MEANYSIADAKPHFSSNFTEDEAPEALLNDVVLQNIFKYLGYKDLKSCREVGNTTWLRNSRKAWWSRTKVVFTGKDGKEDKITDYLNQTEITSNAKNYRFQNFHNGDFKGFWSSLGSSIKYLELFCCNLSSVDTFRKLVYTQCPNIEELVLEHIYFENLLTTGAAEPMKWQEPTFGQQNNLRVLKFVGIDLAMPWMELLCHFPNLQTLEITSVRNVYKMISVIRQHDPKMLKLNSIAVYISLEDDYEQSVRSVLLDANLSFEKIGISVTNCQPETLMQILNLHAKSLKELCVDGQEHVNPFVMLPRSLDQLEKLSIRWCPFTADIFKFTPSLTKFIVHHKGNCDELLKWIDPNLTVNTVKELKLNIHGQWKDSPKSDFEFFLSAFPNVERFETIGLNNERFSMICERWARLVTLIVSHDSRVNHIGILGLDPASEAKDGIRQPNITNLRDLEEFSLSTKRSLYQFSGPLEIHMQHGAVILKELEGLHHLKKFELKDYKLKNDMTWKEVFARYPGH